jgi:hypothetical protein
MPGAPFRQALTIVAALVVASGLVAALFALATGDIRFYPPMLMAVSAVAVILGLPVYVAARAARRDTPLVAAIMGFIVGAAIPLFIVLTRSGADYASVGNTVTELNGSYTAAGWLRNLAFAGFFGLLGTGGALLFWLAVRRTGQSETAPTKRAGSAAWRTLLLPGAALILVAAAFVIPYATADRSCHNPLRDGRNSISVAASFDLRIGADQWRTLGQEIEAFQQSGKWSIRGDPRSSDGHAGLQISLCKEPGTNILVIASPGLNEVGISVYQPQGGSSWMPEFRALYQRMKARWPNDIIFTDREGRETRPPEWAAAEQESR